MSRKLDERLKGVVIGSEVCSREDVHSILLENGCLAALYAQNNWRNVADNLKIPEPFCIGLRNALLLETKDIANVTKDIIKKFMDDNGNNATLERLFYALKDNNLFAYGERLQEKVLLSKLPPVCSTPISTEDQIDGADRSGELSYEEDNKMDV